MKDLCNYFNKAIKVCESVENTLQWRTAYNYAMQFENIYPKEKFIHGYLFGILYLKKEQLFN